MWQELEKERKTHYHSTDSREYGHRTKSAHRQYKLLHLRFALERREVNRKVAAVASSSFFLRIVYRCPANKANTSTPGLLILRLSFTTTKQSPA